MTEPRVCPSEHAHAEMSTCYSAHGCRCGDCRQGHADYEFYRRGMIRAGRWQGRTHVDALGARRRVQALMTLGWSQSEMARRLGMSQNQLWEIAERLETITAPVAERVAALYEELWNVRPTPTTRGERVSVSHALGRAKRRGYAPPMAWDDIDTDEAPQVGEHVDVDEVVVLRAVEGLHPTLTVREREEAVRILHSHGRNDREIAALLDVADETAFRIRTRLGLPERFGQINGRPGRWRHASSGAPGHRCGDAFLAPHMSQAGNERPFELVAEPPQPHLPL